MSSGSSSFLCKNYRTCINGLLMDTNEHNMWCIYVPSYGRVVKMQADTPLVKTKDIEISTLVSKEEALAEMIKALKLESLDDVTLTNISVVYSPRSEQVASEQEEKIVHPCWRIDYVIDPDIITAFQDYSDDGTILISMVDGLVVEYFNWDGV